MDIQQRIGDVIRRKRLSFGWSQHELAQRIGVTRQAVSLMETGETRFYKGRCRLEKLAKVINIPVNELLEVRGKKPVYKSRVRRVRGSIGEYITKWRMQHRVSQHELARSIGLGPCVISRIETHKARRVTTDTLQKLQRVIGNLPPGTLIP